MTIYVLYTTQVYYYTDHEGHYTYDAHSVNNSWTDDIRVVIHWMRKYKSALSAETLATGSNEDILRLLSMARTVRYHNLTNSSGNNPSGEDVEFLPFYEVLPKR